MIVVKSNSAVYGPFASGDEAIDWCDLVRGGLARDELPLMVMTVRNPQTRIPVGLTPEMAEFMRQTSSIS